MIKADEIPRYPQPMEEPEPPKTCYNCTHMVEVKLGGEKYNLCVIERDMSADGSVEECDPEETGCMDWEELL